MDPKKRMYYFDGKSILLDTYDDKAFDQIFEDSKNPNLAQSVNIMDKDKILSDQSLSKIQGNVNVSVENFKESNIDNYSPKRLGKEVFLSLKDHFYKTKGYIENRPEILFEYFLEFKTFEKRHLKIPSKILPLMQFDIRDIQFTLYKNYEELMEQFNKSKQENKNTLSMSKSKPKFTESTLNRLYSSKNNFSKTEKKEISYYVDRLVKIYYNTHKNYTNEPSQLFECWENLSFEEKNNFGVSWPDSNHSFNVKLSEFLSEDNICKRISEMFRKICGYESLHPRPLHDYWSSIPAEERFLKGLHRFPPNEFYEILHKRFLEDKKIKDKKTEEELKEKEKFEKEKLEKNKLKTNGDKEKNGKKITELAKPKDKWKTGKVMLKLQKDCKYDNILNKMIKQEFQDNKVFKYILLYIRFPEEYSIYDSDQEKKLLFKLELEGKVDEKKSRAKEADEKVLEMIQDYRMKDEQKKYKQDQREYNIQKENDAFLNFIKKMCKAYYEKMQRRLINREEDTRNRFLGEWYIKATKLHRNAVNRYFRKKVYGIVKRNRKNRVNFPNEFKYFFFKMIRRLKRNENGKFVWAREDNISYWAPCLSNKCKIHRNYCPLYCRSNTHNLGIKVQRKMNRQTYEAINVDKKLTNEERLHLWKRRDILDDKAKIFLCLDEVEHCTFQPNINKKEGETQISSEDMIKKRASNKVWVDKMGSNFSGRFPLIYKEGILKQAKVHYFNGQFKQALQLLEQNFNIDFIKMHFYNKNLPEAERAKAIEKLLEKQKQKQKEIKGQFSSNYDDELKKKIEPENTKNPKSLHIMEQVFYIVKDIEDYKDEKKREKKKLENELKLIEQAQKEVKEEIKGSENKTNPHATYIKDKYAKFFKTMMCPLKEDCPYDIRPRWPYSDINVNVPMGIKCPYAHHISELKFENEIKERIKLKQKQLAAANKEKDPVIKPFIPTGQLLGCVGCGQGGGTKGVCNFCRYNLTNKERLEKDRQLSKIENEKILERINYQAKKAEEWDNDYEVKFGLIKRSNVLYNFRRFTDAYNVIEKAKKYVLAENKLNDEKYQSLDEKWRKKLQISVKIPKEFLYFSEININILEEYKVVADISTVLVYIEKMKKGTNFTIANRHTFLNNQILLFHNIVEKKIKEYDLDIDLIKKKVEEIDDWGRNKERYKTDKNPEKKRMYSYYTRKYRAEMCNSLLKEGKCIDGYMNCKFAHNPCQLNLVVPEKEKDMLNFTQRAINKKKKKSMPLVPWRPAKQGFIEKQRGRARLKPPKKLKIEASTKFYETSASKSKERRTKSEKRMQSKSKDINKINLFHEI